MLAKNGTSASDTPYLSEYEIRKVYDRKRREIVAEELKACADALLASDLSLRAALTDDDFKKMAVKFDEALSDISSVNETVAQIRERLIWNYAERKNEQKRKRICIQRSGYADIIADTDEEAIEKAKYLTADNFDWEPVTADVIQETVEIVEDVEG